MLYGLGTTIGAGIYALTGEVAGRAGMHTPACFMLAAAIAAFTALSFAELSSRFPRAGGEAVYVREGFGWSWLSTTVGLLVVAAGLVSAATVSVAFVGYLGDFVPVPRALAVVIVTVAIGGVAAWGVQESVTVAGLITIVEVGGLLMISTFGAGHLAALPERAIEMIPLDPSSWGAVASAAILAFYAFLGFEDMVNVAEEVREVRRIMPRAIVATLLVTVLLYVLLSSVAVLAVSPEELAASNAPLVLVFERCGGPAPLLGAIALIALVNGALVQMIKASRMLFGMAGRGPVPRVFARVHSRTRTPLHATVVVTAVAGLLAAALPLAALAETTSTITLSTFALANLALVMIKLNHEPPEGATVYPLFVPVLGFVSSAAFVGFEIVGRLPTP